MTAFTDLESLWHAHYADLMRQATRKVGPDFAEDIVQDVFCNALKAMLNGKGYTDSASGWLFRILHNRIIDHYRSRARRPDAVDIDGDMGYAEQDIDAGWGNVGVAEVMVLDAPTPHDCLEQKAASEQLHRAIDKLPDSQAQTATMRMAGYDYDEIAACTGRSHGAAKAVMTRAYANLRAQLGDAA